MKTKLTEQQAWDEVYMHALGTRWTFRKAIAWFFCKYHYWPSRSLRDMPINEVDLFRCVREVPAFDLHGYYTEHFAFLQHALPKLRRLAAAGDEEAVRLQQRLDQLQSELEVLVGVEEQSRGEAEAV